MSRKPPIEVIRTLRKEVGFGCPVSGCGNPYLEWHHFSPPWYIKEHHNPEGMIALCAEHHKKADAGAYTEEQLSAFKKEAILHAKESKGKFEWLRKDLLAVVGGSFYYDTLTIFEFRKKPIIWFRRDEEGYLLLNISMLTNSGEERAIIEDNIWMNKGNPIDLESPPSGKLLRIDYKNGDHIKIEFFEIKEMQDIRRRFPESTPERWGIELPITAVEVQYKVGGTPIEFGPDYTRLSGFVLKNAFMRCGRCAISLLAGSSLQLEPDFHPAEAKKLCPLPS